MTESGNPFTGAHVLVVDDDATQRLFTRDCLETDGYVVHEAVNGPDGLEQIRSERPDIVLLDVSMPGMDGFEVCRLVRGDPALASLPIVIVTGSEDAKDIQEGFSAGATDFLTKPVDWNLLPYRVRYVLATSKLERELREAKTEAERAAAAKSKLLATMGHELRTPLNAIIGFSDLIRQQAFGPIGSPQYKEYVSDINVSGNRLLRGINDILDIVQSESESLKGLDSDANLAAIASAVYETFQPEAEAAAVGLRNDVPSEPVLVKGDVSRLSQAYAKLVSNAIKFTPAGGDVRLHLDDAGTGAAVLAVTDSGIGMSSEEMPRLLEPFEQADDGLARAYEGMGLGLSVARAFARLYGGDIVLRSQPGRGTTAGIALPASNSVSRPRVDRLKHAC